jgi:hypothetical protein
MVLDRTSRADRPDRGAFAVADADRQPSIDLELALLDPGAVFTTPEELLISGALTRQQKLEVLRRWEYDARESSIATDEGMPDGDNDLLHRILVTIDQLDRRPGPPARSKTGF